MADYDWLQTAEPRLDRAALVILSEFFAAILVAKIHGHARNPIGETTKRMLNDGFDLLRKRWAVLDVAVCIDQDLHVLPPSLCTEIGRQEKPLAKKLAPRDFSSVAIMRQ
jgi:hypothetical protein